MKIALIFQDAADLKTTAEAVLDCLFHGIAMEPYADGESSGLAVDLNENQLFALNREVAAVNMNLKEMAFSVRSLG